jgi:hypothetical protein
MIVPPLCLVSQKGVGSRLLQAKGILALRDEKPMKNSRYGSYNPLIYALFQTKRGQISSNVFIFESKRKKEARGRSQLRIFQ